MTGTTVQRNLSCKLGETWAIDIYCVDGTGGPLNIANSQLTFKMNKIQSNTNVLTVNTASGHIVTTDEANGIALLTVDTYDQVSANIAADFYHYEIRVVLPSNVSSIQYEGDLWVKGSLF